VQVAGSAAPESGRAEFDELMFRHRRHRLHLSAPYGPTTTGASIMFKQATIIVAALALAGLGALRPAQADEMIETRIVMHATSVQTQDVGDVDGHVLGLIRASGIASFQDGSTATAFFVAQTDYVKGSGTNATFNNLTFDDGSVLWYKTSGTATADGARTKFRGTITVLGGKGRFAGATGEGGFNGARIAPLASGADLFLDQMINVKK
jgi:hypothetical protein